MKDLTKNKKFLFALIAILLVIIFLFLRFDIEPASSPVLAASTQRDCSFITTPDDVTWGYCNDGYQFRVQDEVLPEQVSK